MRLLVIGDSMIKGLKEYLFKELPIYDIDLVCLRGERIEGLTRKISSLDNTYDWVLVHVGTNNTSQDVELIIQKYNCLFEEIMRLNPKFKVVVSAILPRNYGKYFKGTPPMLYELNRKIRDINARVERLCLVRETFFFCRSDNLSWNRYLHADGLYLNFQGNRRYAQVFGYALSSLVESNCKRG